VGTLNSATELAIRLARRLPQRGGRRAQLLGYHHVSSTSPTDNVTPARFAEQMAVLAGTRRVRPVLPLDGLLSWLGESTAEETAVSITFDDGHADVVEHALGVLAGHRMPALLYLDSGALGAPGRMSRRQVVDLAGPLVQIGAHSRTHPDLRRCSERELDVELRGSRHDLEDLLGRPVTSFAYPYGSYDDRTVAAVERAGYTTAVTTRRAWLRPGTPLWELPRNFLSDYGAATFAAGIAGGLNWFDRLDPPRPPQAVGGPGRTATVPGP
jgi:peptidoglycan/xylan/chitin deacetylase (PgdA/CDA1 family)